MFLIIHIEMCGKVCTYNESPTIIKQTRTSSWSWKSIYLIFKCNFIKEPNLELLLFHNTKSNTRFHYKTKQVKKK